MTFKLNLLSFFKKKWNVSNVDKQNPSTKFFSSKLSKWKFFILSYFFITITLCPYFNHMNSDFMELNENAFFYFIFSISFFNLFMFSRVVKLREYKVDLLVNFFLLTWKNIFLFFSLIWIKISKWVFFTFSQSNKYYYIYNFVKAKLSSLFVIWRPLFKRLSYYGNYKLTRSKFNNLK